MARSYNLILEQAAPCVELEALVLLHQDIEIIGPGFCAKVRAAFADRQVGVVGCVGAVGVNSIAWWDGEVSRSSISHRYGELGGGETTPLPTAGGGEPASQEVDVAAGYLLALSPWVVRNVRFDESLGIAEGYDYDLCQQVRASGRKVLSANLRVIHHHALELVDDPETWSECHIRAAEKWDQSETDWKQRARRAEAEAAAARLSGASRLLQAYALAAQHDQELQRVTDTRSWRLTRPLRRVNLRLREHRSRSAGG